jgi:hypothetical protein
MTKFFAAEPHVDGTRLYEIGDEREADETEVRHLLDLKVLSTEPVEKKSLPGAEANKAEGKAPSNKSA